MALCPSWRGTGRVPRRRAAPLRASGAGCVALCLVAHHAQCPRQAPVRAPSRSRDWTAQLTAAGASASTLSSTCRDLVGGQRCGPGQQAAGNPEPAGRAAQERCNLVGSCLVTWATADNGLVASSLIMFCHVLLPCTTSSGMHVNGQVMKSAACVCMTCRSGGQGLRSRASLACPEPPHHVAPLCGMPSTSSWRINSAQVQGLEPLMAC